MAWYETDQVPVYIRLNSSLFGLLAVLLTAIGLAGTVNSHAKAGSPDVSFEQRFHASFLDITLSSWFLQYFMLFATGTFMYRDVVALAVFVDRPVGRAHRPPSPSLVLLRLTTHPTVLLTVVAVGLRAANDGFSAVWCAGDDGLNVDDTLCEMALSSLSATVFAVVLPFVCFVMTLLQVHALKRTREFSRLCADVRRVAEADEDSDLRFVHALTRKSRQLSCLPSCSDNDRPQQREDDEEEEESELIVSTPASPLLRGDATAISPPSSCTSTATGTPPGSPPLEAATAAALRYNYVRLNLSYCLSDFWGRAVVVAIPVQFLITYDFVKACNMGTINPAWVGCDEANAPEYEFCQTCLDNNAAFSLWQVRSYYGCHALLILITWFAYQQLKLNKDDLATSSSSLKKRMLYFFMGFQICLLVLASAIVLSPTTFFNDVDAPHYAFYFWLHVGVGVILPLLFLTYDRFYSDRWWRRILRESFTSSSSSSSPAKGAVIN